MTAITVPTSVRVIASALVEESGFVLLVENASGVGVVVLEDPRVLCRDGSVFLRSYWFNFELRPKRFRSRSQWEWRTLDSLSFGSQLCLDSFEVGINHLSIGVKVLHKVFDGEVTGEDVVVFHEGNGGL